MTDDDEKEALARELEKRMVEAGVDPAEFDIMAAQIETEHDQEIMAMYAEIGAEIMAMARQFGCSCSPTVFVYIPFPTDHHIHAARIKHESLCLGQMKARSENN